MANKVLSRGYGVHISIEEPMKEKKPRSAQYYGLIVGRFASGNFLVRRKDGVLVELYKDRATVVLSEVDWLNVEVFDDANPLRRPYYGRHKSPVKDRTEKRDPRDLLLRGEALAAIEHEIWLAIIRHCYFKKLSVLDVVRRARLNPLGLINRLKKTKLHINNRSVASCCAVIAALKIDVGSLLAWHYVSLPTAKIDAGKLFERFIADVRLSVRDSKHVSKSNKMSAEGLTAPELD